VKIEARVQVIGQASPLGVARATAIRGGRRGERAREHRDPDAEHHVRRPLEAPAQPLRHWRAVTPLDFVLLVVAGVGGGLAGSIAGLASLVSYPALLAFGLTPVNANVTNTVALVCSSLGSTLGSRPELRGQAPRVRALAAAAVLGGAAGAGLLLVTSPDTFERIAPWLIAGASVVILLRRRIQPEAPAGRGHQAGARVLTSVFLVGVYGGYFGAAAGVVLLAVLLTATSDTLARANALKNVVLGIANATAAVAFALLADVDWLAALPLAVGLLAGGRLGPVIVRRSDAGVLRTVIGLLGLGLAIKLGLDAYR